MGNALQESFGFVFFPSLRSLAYLQTFSETQRLPQRVLILQGNIHQQKEIAQEALSLGCHSFYDMNLQLQKWLDKHSISHEYLDAKKINDPALEQQLKKEDIKDWVFSGGGILKPELFVLGKRFLHIHPGILPSYRGSTCFYYSYLQEDYVGASAFWMEAQIDAGPPLHTQRFQVQAPEQCPSWFFDHIVDPYIRAQTLQAVLLEQTQAPEYTPPTLDEAYYVIHPWFRELAIARLQQAGSSSFAIQPISFSKQESP